jgi:hypothetical protein
MLMIGRTKTKQKDINKFVCVSTGISILPPDCCGYVVTLNDNGVFFFLFFLCCVMGCCCCNSCSMLSHSALTNFCEHTLCVWGGISFSFHSPIIFSSARQCIRSDCESTKRACSRCLRSCTGIHTHSHLSHTCVDHVPGQ